jgi:outer membrane biosynthesis protein TonB
MPEICQPKLTTDRKRRKNNALFQIQTAKEAVVALSLVLYSLFRPSVDAANPKENGYDGSSTATNNSRPNNSKTQQAATETKSSKSQTPQVKEIPIEIKSTTKPKNEEQKQKCSSKQQEEQKQKCSSKQQEEQKQKVNNRQQERPKQDSTVPPSPPQPPAPPMPPPPMPGLGTCTLTSSCIATDSITTQQNTAFQTSGLPTPAVCGTLVTKSKIRETPVKHKSIFGCKNDIKLA